MFSQYKAARGRLETKVNGIKPKETKKRGLIRVFSLQTVILEKLKRKYSYFSRALKQLPLKGRRTFMTADMLDDYFPSRPSRKAPR